jgi:hypothetical protein
MDEVYSLVMVNGFSRARLALQSQWAMLFVLALSD